MGLVLLGGVAQVQAEVLVEQAGAGVEWEVTAPEQAPVGTASALNAAQGCPTRGELPAITRTAPSAAPV